MIELVSAQTYHARRGSLKNAFRYGVDYVLTDLTEGAAPLLSRNRFNLFSLKDSHHGGPRGQGNGVEWFRKELLQRGFPADRAQLLLLTQPSFLWFHFNPVSFWIAVIDGSPRAFIAEVNNTFGHRHCYFCANEGFRPIQRSDQIEAEKMMHVSPFQQVKGLYRFNFEMTERAFNIRISYENGDQGVLATLNGLRRPATTANLAKVALRRPLGAIRVVALIYWQALKLWIKGAPFMRKPKPPKPLVTDSTASRVGS
ncbi:MAG: cyclopropane-fatty-acyl-phospholipid synthase [Roseobacter sp. MedPE-SW]|nr:MAG: cyclopropane-fatty-acyl-phospholipid synthase [Roseobacter sp. MedPE-SW]